MAIVTENVTVNSKQFKHIYSDAGYYIADSNSKNYVDVYDPEGSSKVYTETSVIIPQTVTQRYFEKRLLTKCDLDLSNSTRPHIIETYSNGTEWYRVFSDKCCVNIKNLFAHYLSIIFSILDYYIKIINFRNLRNFCYLYN